MTQRQFKRMHKACDYIRKHPKLFNQVEKIQPSDLSDDSFHVAGKTFQLIKRLNNRFPLGFTNKELRLIVMGINQ